MRAVQHATASCGSLPCHAMLCHAMPCCAALCCAMSCRLKPEHVMVMMSRSANLLLLAHPNRPHPCSGWRLWLGGPAGQCFYSLHGHFSAVLLHPNPAVMSHCTPCPAPARLHACHSHTHVTLG